MPDHQALREGLVTLLGEEDDELVPPVIRIDGRELPLEFAFRNPSTPHELGAGVQRRTPAILVDGDAWDAANAKIGAEVRVRGKWYEIVTADRNASDVVVADVRASR